jgi:hypothetical protein
MMIAGESLIILLGIDNPGMAAQGAVFSCDGDTVSAVYVIRKSSLTLKWTSHPMAFHQSVPHATLPV